MNREDYNFDPMTGGDKDHAGVLKMTITLIQ